MNRRALASDDHGGSAHDPSKTASLSHHGYMATPQHAASVAHMVSAATSAFAVDDWSTFDVLRDYFDGRSDEMEAITQLYEIANIPFTAGATP